MILYGVIFSPFVQRVLLAARFKGHDLALTPPPGGALSSPAFAAISPMGRIPLLDDDGLILCESAIIVTHLDEVLDGPALLPDGRAPRAHARMIAQLVDGEVAAGFRPFVGHAMFRRPTDAILLDAGRAQIARGLDAIERLLDADGPWATGPQPGIADAALIPFLVLARMMEAQGQEVFIGDRRRVGAYAVRALADPAGARSMAEMRDGFAAFIARMQQAQQQQ